MSPDDIQKSIQNLSDEFELIAKRKLGHPAYRVYLNVIGISATAWYGRSMRAAVDSMFYQQLKCDIQDLAKSGKCAVTGHSLKLGKQFDRCTRCNQWFKHQ